MSRRRGRVHGTPTVNPPQPQSIDDYTGFKVPHQSLKKDWMGLMTVAPDVRNFQDYVRGVKDNMALPNPRPEPPDQYIAQPIIWEDGETIMTVEGNSGNVVLTEGLIAAETL